jgi:2-desacetyl-2-hydroxyethyl bacteriochlorophyllide A dehydrogenase
MNKKMTAAVFSGEGKLVLKKMPVPKIKKSDEVLIKVEAASICGTDVHILSVPPGHPATSGAILCHEYVGEVLETGDDVSSIKPGDKVAIDPNITCGNCEACSDGRHNMCSEMTTLGIFMHGGFAPFNIAPADQCYPYDPDLAPEIAVFAEPLSCVINAVRKISFFPGESCVVLGGGPIGQYFAGMASAAGCKPVIMSEPEAYRRKFAKRSGVDFMVNPEKEDLEKVVREKTGQGADVVVDAVGCLFSSAISLTARGGRIMLFGQNQHAGSEVFQNDITRNELTVMGSYIARHTFPDALKVLESGVLSVKHLITHKIKLDQIHDGMDAMRSGKAMKVIVSF